MGSEELSRLITFALTPAKETQTDKAHHYCCGDRYPLGPDAAIGIDEPGTHGFRPALCKGTGLQGSFQLHDTGHELFTRGRYFRLHVHEACRSVLCVMLCMRRRRRGRGHGRSL